MLLPSFSKPSPVGGVSVELRKMTPPYAVLPKSCRSRLTHLVEKLVHMAVEVLIAKVELRSDALGFLCESHV